MVFICMVVTISVCVSMITMPLSVQDWIWRTRVSFSFLPKRRGRGGGKMRLYGLLGTQVCICVKSMWGKWLKIQGHSLLCFPKASITVSLGKWYTCNCMVFWEVELSEDCASDRWETGYFPAWPKAVVSALSYGLSKLEYEQFPGYSLLFNYLMYCYVFLFGPTLMLLLIAHT